MCLEAALPLYSGKQSCHALVRATCLSEKCNKFSAPDHELLLCFKKRRSAVMRTESWPGSLDRTASACKCTTFRSAEVFQHAVLVSFDTPLKQPRRYPPRKQFLTLYVDLFTFDCYNAAIKKQGGCDAIQSSSLQNSWNPILKSYLAYKVHIEEPP